jgi:hypothetical protein
VKARTCWLAAATEERGGHEIRGCGGAGGVLAGTGFGVAFLGAFRTLSALADAGERADLIAGIFTVNYLAFGIPALIAGVAVTRYGLHRTALVYPGVIAALAAAAGSMTVRQHSAGQRPRARRLTLTGS